MSRAASPAPAVILGAGGHARVVASILTATGRYLFKGFLDRTADTAGEDLGEGQVLGSWDDRLAEFGQDPDACAFLAFGDGGERAAMAQRCRDAGLALPALVHPTACIDPTARIGEGSVVCAQAFLGPQAQVGEGVLVNTAASIDHESRIGDYATLSPRVTIAGRTSIGARTFIGIAACVADRLTVGADARIGAGAVVLNDVPGGAFVVGIPATAKASAT